MKISFVLPCYNVERYIVVCLESLYNQDLPKEEFEVICVDDCSTDRTHSIIDEYSKRHSNLTLIGHVENLTAGGARNTGIKVARGEYIWFVDPDDMIEPNCLFGLYSKAASKSVDVLMFNFKTVDEHLNPILYNNDNNNCFQDSEVLSGQDYVMRYTPSRFSVHCMVWRCLYRTTFLRERNLYYPIMRKAQDVSFLWKVLLKAEKVMSVKESFYVYRHNPYSVANKMLEAHVVFSDRILRASRIVDMIEDKGLHIAIPIVDDMWRALRWCVNSTVQVLCNLPIDERANYYSEIISHKEDVKKVVPYMNRKNRLIFSTSMGKCVWMKKVQVICYREGRRIRK